MRVGYTAIGGSGERVQRTLVVPVTDAGTRWPEASGAFKFSATVAGLGLALGDTPVASVRPGAGGSIAVHPIYTEHLNSPRVIKGCRCPISGAANRQMPIGSMRSLRAAVT